MKPTELPKGHSQLEVKATLRHRDQVNDTVSVTFDHEPTLEALERYAGHAARILDSHATQDRILQTNMAGVWKTKYKAAERALRAVLEHIAPIVEDFEKGPAKDRSEHPVIADIRALLKTHQSNENNAITQPHEN